jgi:hypothetical protein
MLLSKMPHHPQSYPLFVRPDKEEFAISSVLYESPAEYDYWLAHITVTHGSWQPSALTAIIPKKIASTVAFGLALLRGPILDQVQSNLMSATATGRDYLYVPSVDGWMLLG